MLGALFGCAGSSKSQVKQPSKRTKRGASSCELGGACTAPSRCASSLLHRLSSLGGQSFAVLSIDDITAGEPTVQGGVLCSNFTCALALRQGDCSSTGHTGGPPSGAPRALLRLITTEKAQTLNPQQQEHLIPLFANSSSSALGTVQDEHDLSKTTLLNDPAQSRNGAFNASTSGRGCDGSRASPNWCNGTAHGEAQGSAISFLGSSLWLLPMHINTAMAGVCGIPSTAAYAEQLRPRLISDAGLAEELVDVAQQLAAGFVKVIVHNPVSKTPRRHVAGVASVPALAALRLKGCYCRESDGTLSPAVVLEHILTVEEQRRGAAAPAAGGCTAGGGGGAVEEALNAAARRRNVNRPARPPSLTSHSARGPLQHQDQIRGHYVVSQVSSMLTLLQFDGRVLFQNVGSENYWGLLKRRGGYATASALVLQHLFELEPHQQGEMLEAIKAGQTWKKVVRVPSSALEGRLICSPPTNEAVSPGRSTGETPVAVDARRHSSADIPLDGRISSSAILPGAVASHNGKARPLAHSGACQARQRQYQSEPGGGSSGTIALGVGNLAYIPTLLPSRSGDTSLLSPRSDVYDGEDEGDGEDSFQHALSCHHRSISSAHQTQDNASDSHPLALCGSLAKTASMPSVLVRTASNHFSKKSLIGTARATLTSAPSRRVFTIMSAAAEEEKIRRSGSTRSVVVTGNSVTAGIGRRAYSVGQLTVLRRSSSATSFNSDDDEEVGGGSGGSTHNGGSTHSSCGTRAGGGACGGGGGTSARGGGSVISQRGTDAETPRTSGANAGGGRRGSRNAGDSIEELMHELVPVQHVVVRSANSLAGRKASATSLGGVSLHATLAHASSMSYLPAAEVEALMPLEEQTDDNLCYHEIEAVAVIDPVTGQRVRALGPGACSHGRRVYEGLRSQVLIVDMQAAGHFMEAFSCLIVILLIHADITQRAVLEQGLAMMTEAQMSMMEQMFPRHILTYLVQSDTPADRQRNYAGLARAHEDVTILFTDIVGFTSMSKEVHPSQVMSFLNELFTAFDTLVEQHGVYKVETAGDCYIAAGGLATKDDEGFTCVGDEALPSATESATTMLAFAKSILQAARRVRMPHDGSAVRIRVGLHTGPIVTGLIGSKLLPKFGAFGDSMNSASRMESTCPVGGIQVSEVTFGLLQPEARAGFNPTGGIEVKGKGLMHTHVLIPLIEGDDIEEDEDVGGNEALLQLDAQQNYHHIASRLRVSSLTEGLANGSVAAAVAAALANTDAPTLLQPTLSKRHHSSILRCKTPDVLGQNLSKCPSYQRLALLNRSSEVGAGNPGVPALSWAGSVVDNAGLPGPVSPARTGIITRMASHGRKAAGLPLEVSSASGIGSIPTDATGNLNTILAVMRMLDTTKAAGLGAVAVGRPSTAQLLGSKPLVG